MSKTALSTGCPEAARLQKEYYACLGRMSVDARLLSAAAAKSYPGFQDAFKRAKLTLEECYQARESLEFHRSSCARCGYLA